MSNKKINIILTILNTIFFVMIIAFVLSTLVSRRQLCS